MFFFLCSFILPQPGRESFAPPEKKKKDVEVFTAANASVSQLTAPTRVIDWPHRMLAWSSETSPRAAFLSGASSPVGRVCRGQQADTLKDMALGLRRKRG